MANNDLLLTALLITPQITHESDGIVEDVVKIIILFDLDYSNADYNFYK